MHVYFRISQHPACILGHNLEFTKSQAKISTPQYFYIQAFCSCQYLVRQTLTKSSNFGKTILGPILAETASPPGLGPIRPDVSRDVMPFLCTRVSLNFSSLLGCISFLLPPLLFLFFLFTLVILLAQGVFLFLLAYLSILIFLDFICCSTGLSSFYAHCPHHTPFSKPNRSR